MSDYKDLTLKDFFNGTAREYMCDVITRSDAGIALGHYDQFGADFNVTVDTYTTFLFFYKFYFRVEAHGVENIPAEGPALVVSNHAPILPVDAMMLGTATLVEPERPRFIRTIANRALSDIPFFSTWLSRAGQVIGCDENVRRIFENRNLMLVFPTGAEGDMNTIFNKYRLHEFTIGFMEYALRYRTPIIPTCVTGSEEAALTLAKLDVNMGGFKHLPITPIFPWLGPLGVFPFPSKFNIYFDPLADYFTDHADEVDSPDKVRAHVDDLRARIQNMLDTALGRV